MMPQIKKARWLSVSEEDGRVEAEVELELAGTSQLYIATLKSDGDNGYTLQTLYEEQAGSYSPMQINDQWGSKLIEQLLSMEHIRFSLNVDISSGYTMVNPSYYDNLNDDIL
ncbi:hypothetical protein [Paenibacillus senegalensis]|uniref:hypothetical protein n=1 Tax=Paenibacillus senegalensis TaxID=1465766 RepID=UPI000289AAFD|nr:hypothetical protein [Paenibacillus senegalensis]